eukprot:scaffold2299_cov359-Prasinococcus_capsulatus_cf.AAC.8
MNSRVSPVARYTGPGQSTPQVKAAGPRGPISCQGIAADKGPDRAVRAPQDGSSARMPPGGRLAGSAGSGTEAPHLQALVERHPVSS